MHANHSGTEAGRASAALRRRFVRWVGQKWARIEYARRVEPTWIELVRHRIPVREIPADLRGLRIVQLSDFHLSHRSGSLPVRESIAIANACEPDLVALTGDFVHRGFQYVELIAQLVAELRAPHGVFAVLGNHDYAVRLRLRTRRHARLYCAVERALESHGVRVLRNEFTTIARGKARIGIVGIDDLWSRTYDVERALGDLPANLPRVVLAHNPRTIELLGRYRCDLMLSGHTHGGQVNLPRIGAPLLAGRMRHYRAGLYEYEHAARYLYVNKGVGCGVPVRYGARPEVAELQLVRHSGHATASKTHG